MAIVRSFEGKTPLIGDGVFLAETAVVVGDVEIGARSSIWYGAVLRGDVHYIRVGEETSIQDGSILHVTGGKHATRVGDRVTVGHAVTLHGCTVHDRCIIGMGSVVLDQAEIGEGCIVAAGSVVTPGTRIPPGSLAVGSPARVRRDLTPDELVSLDVSAEHYLALARKYGR